MRNLSKIIVLRVENRPLYLPLKIEKKWKLFKQIFLYFKIHGKILIKQTYFYFF